MLNKYIKCNFRGYRCGAAPIRVVRRQRVKYKRSGEICLTMTQYDFYSLSLIQEVKKKLNVLSHVGFTCVDIRTICLCMYVCLITVSPEPLLYAIHFDDLRVLSVRTTITAQLNIQLTDSAEGFILIGGNTNIYCLQYSRAY